MVWKGTGVTNGRLCMPKQGRTKICFFDRPHKEWAWLLDDAAGQNRTVKIRTWHFVGSRYTSENTYRHIYTDKTAAYTPE